MGHQRSFCYKDLTLRHFVVSSISVRRARVINWKSVFNMLKFILNKEYSRTTLIFCLLWRILLLNHTDYFKKLTMNMLHRKIRVNGGFGFSKVVIWRLQIRNIENHQKSRRCGIASIVGRRWFVNTNNSPSNWALVNKLFPIGHERWCGDFHRKQRHQWRDTRPPLNRRPDAWRDDSHSLRLSRD